MEFCSKCGRPMYDDGMGIVPLIVCECPLVIPQYTVQQKCPICEGHGIVPGGFYQAVADAEMVSTNATEQCKNCNGLGVVLVKQ